MSGWIYLAIYAYWVMVVWDLYWRVLDRPKLGEAMACAALGWPGAVLVWCLWNLEDAGDD